MTASSILVSDAVAEVSREIHEGELKTMGRLFAEAKTTDEVLGVLRRKGAAMRVDLGARRLRPGRRRCRPTMAVTRSAGPIGTGAAMAETELAAQVPP